MKERKEKTIYQEALSSARLTLAKDRGYLPKKIRTKSDSSVPLGKTIVVSLQNKCICGMHWQGSLKDCL